MATPWDTASSARDARSVVAVPSGRLSAQRLQSLAVSPAQRRDRPWHGTGGGRITETIFGRCSRSGTHRQTESHLVLNRLQAVPRLLHRGRNRCRSRGGRSRSRWSKGGANPARDVLKTAFVPRILWSPPHLSGTFSGCKSRGIRWRRGGHKPSPTHTHKEPPAATPTPTGKRVATWSPPSRCPHRPTGISSHWAPSA
jgi:hypothetical protein